jgi:hypothetical protein
MILPLENPVNLVKIVVQTKIPVQTTGDCGSEPRNDGGGSALIMNEGLRLVLWDSFQATGIVLFYLLLSRSLFSLFVGADQKVRFRHCEPLGEAIQSIDFQWIASGFALAMTELHTFWSAPFSTSRLLSRQGQYVGRKQA